MSSLSENNNSIIATSYQSKLTLSTVANMTTSPTTKPNGTNTSIDAKNMSEIWKSNFNNNAAYNRQSLNMDNTKISWANINNNNNNQAVLDTESASIEAVASIKDNMNSKNKKEVTDSVVTDSKHVKKVDEDSDNSISNMSMNGKVEVEKYSNDDGNENLIDNNVSPSHHARRPMNAFLIFCKKHRPIVRNKFPALENRGVTRILGEWWSLLDSKDKDPYTKLAKQYKDAFFTANPDFKWYKLPAPPLRTLPTRPTKNDQVNSPPVSPSNLVAIATNNTSPVTTADFTPGKLADESQLGMLSSLLTGNLYAKIPLESETNNNNTMSMKNENDNDHTPISQQNAHNVNETPPKPLKKRLVSDMEIGQKSDLVNNKIVRNLFDDQDKKTEEDGFSEDNNDANSNGRKSYRKGKGNRYADIMANGKLIKTKRASTEKIPNESSGSPGNKLELNTTIKKLQERLNTNALSTPMTETEKFDKTETANVVTTTIATTIVATNCTIGNSNNLHTQPVVVGLETRDMRTRTISEVSEMSDVADYSKAIPSFDLDSRIGDLPNLSYDTYVQRKKDAKKKKLPKGGTAVGKLQQKAHQPKTLQSAIVGKRSYDSIKHDGVDELHKNELVNGKVNIEKQTGSKKRKNKHNITHLENNSLIQPSYENDLYGLETLAEIASNLRTKLNQNNNNNNSNNNNNKI